MDENVPVSALGGKVSFLRSRAFETIVFGGLTVGLLDGLAAVINAGFRGVGAVRVFQFIAGGIVGSASYRGGAAAVLLGVFLHFAIAFFWTAVFYRASLSFPILIRQAVLCGVLYGVIVHIIMSGIVVPLSAAGKIPFSYKQFFIATAIHILCVGLPIALITRFTAKKSSCNRVVDLQR